MLHNQFCATKLSLVSAAAIFIFLFLYFFHFFFAFLFLVENTFYICDHCNSSGILFINNSFAKKKKCFLKNDSSESLVSWPFLFFMLFTSLKMFQNLNIINETVTFKCKQNCNKIVQTNKRTRVAIIALKYPTSNVMNFWKRMKFLHFSEVNFHIFTKLLIQHLLAKLKKMKNIFSKYDTKFSPFYTFVFSIDLRFFPFCSVLYSLFVSESFITFLFTEALHFTGDSIRGEISHHCPFHYPP
jgi:hypothetical protein